MPPPEDGLSDSGFVERLTSTYFKKLSSKEYYMKSILKGRSPVRTKRREQGSKQVKNKLENSPINKRSKRFPSIDSENISLERVMMSQENIGLEEYLGCSSNFADKDSKFLSDRTINKASINKDKLKELLQNPIKKKKEIQANTCQICFDNPPNVVIMDCGHGGLCYDCAIGAWRNSNECFLCREVNSSPNLKANANAIRD